MDRRVTLLNVKVNRASRNRISIARECNENAIQWWRRRLCLPLCRNLALLVRYYFRRRHQRGFPAGLLYRGDNSSLLAAPTSSGRWSHVGLPHPKCRNKSSRIGGWPMQRSFYVRRRAQPRFNKGSAARLWRLIPVKNTLQVEFTIVDDQVRNLSCAGEEAELFRSEGWINKIFFMRSPNNQLEKWNLQQISEFEINSSIMAIDAK